MEPLRVAVGIGIAGHAQRIEPRVGAPGDAVVDLDGVDVGFRGTLGGLLGSRQSKSSGGEEAEEGDEGDGGLHFDDGSCRAG